jgi:hypothetical protein
MLKSIRKMSKDLRIAFGYRMGMGKDEACNYLIKKYGGEQISFAAPIYDIQRYAQERCGFKPEKDRQFLQYIGTDWARKKEPNIWVRLALEATPKGGNVFLSDLRFPNEFEALKKEGWTCVKLIRPHQEDRKGSGSHTHASENALDSIPNIDWDAVVLNDGSLQHFYAKLDILVDTING